MQIAAIDVATASALPEALHLVGRMVPGANDLVLSADMSDQASDGGSEEAHASGRPGVCSRTAGAGDCVARNLPDRFTVPSSDVFSL